MLRRRALTPLLPLLLVACAATGHTPDDQRAHIDRRTEEVLERLYRESPAAEKQISDSAGYAVFSNLGVDLLLVGGGGGYGVAVDRSSGKRTYMKVGEAGVGIGFGVKDYRAVLVFKTEERLRRFVDSGWDASVEAAASAEVEGKGATASGAASFTGDMAIYQLTETGLALRANVRGIRYWKDASLN